MLACNCFQALDICPLPPPPLSTVGGPGVRTIMGPAGSLTGPDHNGSKFLLVKGLTKYNS
jgi:hypothetical protein